MTVPYRVECRRRRAPLLLLVLLCRHPKNGTNLIMIFKLFDCESHFLDGAEKPGACPSRLGFHPELGEVKTAPGAWNFPDSGSEIAINGDSHWPDEDRLRHRRRLFGNGNDVSSVHEKSVLKPVGWSQWNTLPTPATSGKRFLTSHRARCALGVLGHTRT
ncbi:hypothetical protein ZHAS_00015229 [Anopheles sinensis]|uniref:Uncharacterized protein n=1 Tax=Anopheles sinensis TaxID=74873 RepID=A0A084WAG2_ANOSI|nr:hypothetical protein ZHAS_00015229 [Anopheles sinensis]